MRSMLPKTTAENPVTVEHGSSATASEVAEYPTPSAEFSADDFWKAVNERDIDRKVAMDSLRAAEGDFVAAMENITNA